MLEAEELITRKIWYNRHWSRQIAIDKGDIKLVSKDELSTKPYKSGEILDTVWDGALLAARKTEEEIGLENLGPWDDFEWGMLSGKLSAIRWVLGYDWDVLDT